VRVINYDWLAVDPPRFNNSGSLHYCFVLAGRLKERKGNEATVRVRELDCAPVFQSETLLHDVGRATDTVITNHSPTFGHGGRVVA
jgi:hypothetical protein